jgi:DNA polymerase-3 subunit alpha
MTIHLNGRSHFSLGESLLTPEDIVNLYADKGATCLTLTDTMVISGMAEFNSACKKKGIKPIIGARLRVVDELITSKDSKKEIKPYFLRVLIRTDAGYKAMLKLLSRSFEEGHFFEVPHLLLSDVCELLGNAGREASLVLLGDFYGALQQGKGAKVCEALREAGISYASEIVPLCTPHFIRHAHDALMLQENEGVAAVISLPALYKTADQADSLDLMQAIARHLKLDERSSRHVFRQFVPQAQIDVSRLIAQLAIALFKRYPTEGTAHQWMDRLKVANDMAPKIEKSVTYIWEKEKPSLPVMAPDEFAALVKECQEGWHERFAKPVFGHLPEDLAPYKERLKYELGVLRKLKFEAYFLLVSKIVKWSKEQGILVGPGRGSVGGSLVAYLMGITDVDPLRFNLLFERFINPDRIDLPDADLDFMSTRREGIVQWIKSEYGDDKVAAVSNYTTLAAAGALKDICRTLQVFGNEMVFGRLVPKEHGNSYSLTDAIAEVPELAKFADENPEVIRHALNLEDRMRSYGKHAAGIVVAGVPLAERAVVERRGGELIVNWDKRLVEDFGLVKIDVLGLSTLDMIDITLRHIWRMHGKRIVMTDIPLDDTTVYEAFGRGEAIGVFQFESSGMRGLLKKLALISPLTFEDITAATALYRPGPMDSGLMEQFIKIKQGEILPSYPHPNMEDALKDTYGVMVYQEEVMQVARDFAGFSLIESDHLRKIMGKKLPAEMAKWRDKFVEGAMATSGVDKDFADEIFSQIEKFAGYGFNKSHASAYSLISYICMWLKVHYPVEFFGGLLTMVKQDRRANAIADMKRLGIKLLPPDINDSSDVFEPLHGLALLAPFNAVKQVSENATAAIVKARTQPNSKDGHAGRFRSIEDFTDRVERRKCNSRVVEALNKVGAFSRVETDQLPADDHTRRRDQIELMEGLIDEAVIIDRPIVLDHFTVPRLTEVIASYRACDRCELKGLCHPRPHIMKNAKAFLVLDGPNYKEEAKDQIGFGGHMEVIEEAAGAVGMKLDDFYITTLIKSPKPEKSSWSNKTLAECPVWLDREIAELRPPLIVTLGSLAARHFVSDLKGGPTEHAGRIVFDKARDANILIGINPGSVFFDHSKGAVVDRIFAQIPALLPT